tara:strand:- start:2612 stop:3022 length:411 start_codon:yes stop_codon:yes gene_type:complete
MDIPDNVLNPAIYRRAKKIADETYKRNSAYKSMFLVSKYKELGGKYKGVKSVKGVKRWNEEKWIQVLPFLESGKKIACGFGEGGKSCRPTKRIDSETPLTINQLIKKHGKKKLMQLAMRKKNNMSLRVDWEKGTIS